MNEYCWLKIVWIFLTAAAILTSGWFQNVVCIAAEEKPGTQKLKEEMRNLWSKDAYLRDWLVCGVFPSPSGEGNEYPRQCPEYIHWWTVTERHNVIMLEPHGRGNSMYNGIGDMDVLNAIQAARDTFSVDDAVIASITDCY